MTPAAHTACFTAAQIGRARGVPSWRVRRWLRHTPADGACTVKGNEAAAWWFESLPDFLRTDLCRIAKERGFHSACHLLAEAPALWTPPLPLERVPAEFQQRAVKLREALAPFLARQHSTRTPQLLENGRAQYRKVFGHSVSARTWLRLLDRTTRRDGGCEDWQRLALYLDDAAFQLRTPAPGSIRHRSVHRELDDAIAGVENKEKPSADDRAFLFDAGFHHYEKLGVTNPDKASQRQLKASLIDYLFAAFPVGWLAKTKKSLRRVFDLKFKQWQANDRTPAGIMDSRPLKSGNFRRPDFTEDEKKIYAQAVLHGGNESLALRLSRERGELSPAFMKYHASDPRRNKSYVPKSIRETVTPKVEMCGPLHRGPREARMRGPYIPRDWSAVQPGDYFSADDVTWNHYFKVRDESGHWQILRGECLLMTDLRSGYPLDFLLISGHYNGEHIRSLIIRVHDTVGLPRKGFLFERGAWASRLIVGDKQQGDLLHWRETELGLRERGLDLKIHHATTPRAKPIECLLRILQERMRGIPGFVGFNERLEKMERVQKLIARAQSGDEQALAQFPTAPAWRDQICQVLEEFKRDPQNGEMLAGSSPNEVWAAEMAKSSLRQLPIEARFILATHKKVVTVRQQGILLTIRRKRKLYYNEHTGRFIGQQMLAFYNIECPSLLTVSDMKRQHFFTVKEAKLPAMNATPEQLAEVNRARRGHMAHAAALYGGIQHSAISTITRDGEHGEATEELGRFHNEAVEQHQAEETAEDVKQREIKRLCAKLGMPPPRFSTVRNLDDYLEGLRLKVKRLEKQRQTEVGNSTLP